MRKHIRSGAFQAGIALILGAFLAVSCKSSEELKAEQYFVTGQQLYITYCANCHQLDGKGMSNLYPPIDGSSMISDKAGMACIIRNGMRDTIIVNGKQFSRPMPANPKLTEIEIAEIVSFIAMKWGKDSTYTHIDFVHEALEKCAAR